MRPALPIAAILLAAGAATGITAPSVARDRPDAVPVATPAGPAVNCIPLRGIRETRVRDDRSIDFVMFGRDRVYRVVLPQACPGLGVEQRFSYATSLGELCSSDIITVLEATPLRRGASCGLAPFQPVTLPARPR